MSKLKNSAVCKKVKVGKKEEKVRMEYKIVNKVEKKKKKVKK